MVNFTFDCAISVVNSLVLDQQIVNQIPEPLPIHDAVAVRLDKIERKDRLQDSGKDAVGTKIMKRVHRKEKCIVTGQLPEGSFGWH